MYSKDVENAIREVVNNKDEYSQTFIANFGVTQATISRLRNGKRDINNMKLPTIKSLLNAYEYKNNDIKIKDKISTATDNSVVLNKSREWLDKGYLTKAVLDLRLIVIPDSYKDRDMVDQFKDYDWMLNEAEDMVFNVMSLHTNDEGTEIINMTQEDALTVDNVVFDYLYGTGIKFELSGNFKKLKRGFAREYVVNEDEVKDKMFYFDGEKLTTLTADKLRDVINYLDEKYGA